MVQGYQTGLNNHRPTTDYAWDMHRAMQTKMVEWETEANEQQELENNISVQVEFLEDRGDEGARSSQNWSHLSRESQQLEFLSQTAGFWKAFDDYHTAYQSLVDIESDLKQSTDYKKAVNDAITRTYKRDFLLAEDVSNSFSIVKEKMVFQDLSQISGHLNKHNELQDRKLAAEKLQTEHWMRLLVHAENAFIATGVLEMRQEIHQAEKEDQEEG